MNKAIIIPDSFKGTLKAEEVCHIISDVIRIHYPMCEVFEIPVADGGEGTVDAFFYAMGGEKKKVNVRGPLHENVNAEYLLTENGSTAVIEMAACSGLALAGGRKDPSLTTTYGVGSMISHALDRNVKKIVLGLGGSSTNDGGCGMAAALGVVFTDKTSTPFIPVGKTLKDIDTIDMNGLDRRIKDTEIVVMCDVTNPLYGPDGAAFVYAPQKGADETMVKSLDEGLVHFSKSIEKHTGKDVSHMPGAGAAGGMGAGAVIFLNATLCSGIDTVLEAVDFRNLVRGADIVFTGEGRVDRQSIDGKVISGVAPICRREGVPLYVLTGSVIEPVDELYDLGVTAIFPITENQSEQEYISESKAEDIHVEAKNNLKITTDSVIGKIK